MIKAINLENFQSHKNSVLEFHNGMNVIVGSSDSGKTAIIRALKWISQNRPGGDDFRSTWGGDTNVVVQTTENTIIRSKSKNANTYELDDHLFSAFGTDVPEEINSALNLNEINLQQQMDDPFLLSEHWTSGKVALHFNKVARLHKIDKGTSYVQKEINSINSTIKHTETELDNKKEQIFFNVKKIDSLFPRLN